MSSMWLNRLRIQFKSVLPRTSLPYRVCHFCYQLLVRIQDRFKSKTPPREISENSIFTREEEMSMCSIFPKEILDLTIALYHPRSVLDVGCGTGVSLDYFKRKGITARGLEGSALAISKARHKSLMQQHELSEPIDLGQTFDLVWCFEVAEHIHPRHVSALLETLTKHGDRILLSAATPGQGGLGHLNERPPEYWIGLMDEREFSVAPETERFHTLPDHFAKNILVFERRPPARDFTQA